jgi:DNA polymerase-3 subunit beta
MKITVSRSDLGSAVAFAKTVRRPAVPVLAGVRLEVADGVLTVATFDYEETRRVHVAGDGASAGVVLVDGAQFTAAVKGMAKGKTVTAELQAGESGLTVRCAGVTSQLAALPMDQYPQLPEMPALSGTFGGHAFSRSVARVAAAASHDDTLPMLTGIMVRTGAGAVSLAATDRYRLATDSLDWTPADLDAETTEHIIPWAPLTAFAKGCGGKVAAHFGENHAGFSDGTRELIIRCLDGEFLKYRQLLKDDFEAHAVLDAAVLAGAVKRAGAALERNEPVRMHFDPAESVVTVTAMRDGTIASTEQVAAAFEGAALDIAFNPVYLGSLLTGVTGPARLSFNGARKPAQVTSTDETDAYRAIVVPIRTAA